MLTRTITCQDPPPEMSLPSTSLARPVPLCQCCNEMLSAIGLDGSGVCGASCNCVCMCVCVSSLLEEGTEAVE